MRRPRRPSKPNEALRLVKSWLPTALVREMDLAILASNGAYNGRDDFVREAISDRIAEERRRPVSAAAPIVLLRSSTKGEKSRNRAAEWPRAAMAVHESEPAWPRTRVPTLPAHQVGGILYGLHNRDYPTLWVARSLLGMASERGGLIPWSDFIAAVLEAAWNIGAQLARMDSERTADEQKASVGFPSNSDKRQSSEARFSEHMVGVPDRHFGPSGPLFAMKLAGTDRAADRTLIIAPTRQAVELWKLLLAAGLGTNERPPHPPAAWRAFREHLQLTLAEDYAAWMRVLTGIDRAPTRDDLVTHFSDEWVGAAAATNVAGYVSRGREWGLVEPKLKEGRYVLTDLGREAIGEACG